MLGARRKKTPTDHGWGFCIWWSRGELNPRPQALCRQFYMRSQSIYVLTLVFADRQARPQRFT